MWWYMEKKYEKCPQNSGGEQVPALHATESDVRAPISHPTLQPAIPFLHLPIGQEEKRGGCATTLGSETRASGLCAHMM